MKRVAAIWVLLLLLTASARADWTGLKPGMSPYHAWQCAGMPLMQYGARGAEMWTYDFGGYILFENGRVTCWSEPKPQPTRAVARQTPEPPPANASTKDHAMAPRSAPNAVRPAKVLAADD